jgi:outer membrane protein
MIFRLLIFGFVLVMTAPVNAVTREAAVKFALEKSEAMKKVSLSAKAIEAQGNQVPAFSKPQIDMESGYTEMGGNGPENPYFPTPDRDISGAIEASQVLYAGGRIKKSYALQRNLKRQGDFLIKSGKRDIARQVCLAFDTVLYRKASVNILNDRVDQRSNEMADARDLKDVGMVTSLDVRQAQLSLNLARANLEAGEASYRESLIDFNLVIGNPVENDLFIPEGDLKAIPDIQIILNRLNEALRSEELIDIKNAQTKYEAARLNFQLTAGEALPEVAIFSSGKSNGDSFDEMNESWNVGIRMKWNVLDGGLVREKKAAANADIKIESNNMTDVKKKAAGDIEKIGINLRSLEQRITIQKEAVELSKENYNDARGQYRAGTITLTRLGEFSLSHAEARFNLLGLFYLQRENIIQAEALLEM